MVDFVGISDGGIGGGYTLIQFDLYDLAGKEVEGICLHCFEN
jgi:hypothetical protein